MAKDGSIGGDLPKAYEAFKGQPYADEILEMAANERPRLVKQYFFELYRDKPYANSILAKEAKLVMGHLDSTPKEFIKDYIQRVAREWIVEGLPDLPELVSLKTHLMEKIIDNNPIQGLVLYGKYKDLPGADGILKMAIQKTSDLAMKEEGLGYFLVMDNIKNIKGLDEIPGGSALVEKCGVRMTTDPQIKKVLLGLYMQSKRSKEISKNFENDPKMMDFLKEGGLIQDGFEGAKTANDKERFVQDAVRRINPKLEAELKGFNEASGVSLRPISLRQLPFEFVFINTWENPKDKSHLPIRIALGLDELKNADAINLIKNRFQADMASKQVELWEKRGFGFDLPKNGKTSFMVAAVPKATGSDYLVGSENSMANMANIYRTQFGAQWEGSVMQDSEAWNAALAKNGLEKNAPSNSLATKENILNGFRDGLKKAIDSGQEMFLFQYIMHGSPENGLMAATNDAPIEAEEYAKVFSEKYNGKPLAEQIGITLVIESCFGGVQLENIIKYLEKEKIPVKELRIVSGAQREAAYKYDPSGLTISLGAESDPRSPMTNYIKYYFEWIDRRKASGEVIKPPLGTMGHAIAFADRMQKSDTDLPSQMLAASRPDLPDRSKFVDLQGYYYSTENPIKNPEPTSPTGGAEPSGYYFSERDSGAQSEKAA